MLIFKTLYHFIGSLKNHAEQVVIPNRLVKYVVWSLKGHFVPNWQKSWNVWEIQCIVHNNPNHPITKLI